MRRYFCSSLICGRASDYRECSPWHTTYARIGGDIVRKMNKARGEYLVARGDDTRLNRDSYIAMGLLPPDWDYYTAHGYRRHTVLDIPPEIFSALSQLGGLYV